MNEGTARVIEFEPNALASLRQRLGAAEEAQADLIAFARGHSEAVTSIHRAVLSAIAATDIDELFDIVSRDWPIVLSIDSVALALDRKGIEPVHLDGRTVRPLDCAWFDKLVARGPPVVLRAVDRGHPLFGAAGPEIRTEALIRFACGRTRGLLALGQAKALDLGPSGGGQLLRFLGDSLGAIIARWPTDRPTRLP